MSDNVVEFPGHQPSIYIAGPMSGYPHLNREKFDNAAEAFREGGWEVFNPAENDLQLYGEGWFEDNDGTKEACEAAKKKYGVDVRDLLGTDLDFICYQADAIAMLPGWEKSLGARAEHATAVALGLDIIYIADVTED